MQRVLDTKKKALYVLPAMAQVEKKTSYLRDLLSKKGIRVEGFSMYPAGGLCVTDIAVVTIEKANNLVTSLMEEGRLDSLACVVVDQVEITVAITKPLTLKYLISHIFKCS